MEKSCNRSQNPLGEAVAGRSWFSLHLQHDLYTKVRIFADRDVPQKQKGFNFSFRISFRLFPMRRYQTKSVDICITSKSQDIYGLCLTSIGNSRKLIRKLNLKPLRYCGKSLMK